MPQHGVELNVAKKASDPAKYSFGPELSPAIPTLGHIFQGAGYRTPYFGKWHLSNTGDDDKADLSRYGFEDWRRPDHFGAPKEGLHFDSSFADQTVAWLEANGKQAPWFLTCSFVNPHDICFFSRQAVPASQVPDVCDRVPDNFNDDLKNKPRIQHEWRRLWGRLYGTEFMTEEKCRHYIDFYYYLQLQVEAQIARVLDALDRMDLAKDTLVLFFSDHGEMAGSHRLMTKGPFGYHENNQVPLIFRWPGRIPAGTVAKALAQSVDIFPTLLGLAGINYDCSRRPGKSLMPAIADHAVTGINDHILMAWGFGRETFNRQTRIYLQPEVKVPAQIRAIYDGRYKFARYFDPGVPSEYELYDLVNDPLEMRNLAGDAGYEALRREMEDRLREAEAGEMGPLVK